MIKRTGISYLQDAIDYQLDKVLNIYAPSTYLQHFNTVLDDAKQQEQVVFRLEDCFSNESILDETRQFPALENSAVVAVNRDSKFNGNAVHVGNGCFVTAWHVVQDALCQYSITGETVEGNFFELPAVRISLPNEYMMVDIAVLYVENLNVNIRSVNMANFYHKKHQHFQTASRSPLSDGKMSVFVNEHKIVKFDDIQITYPLEIRGQIINQKDKLADVYYVGNTKPGWSGSGVYSSMSFDGQPTIVGIHIRGGNTVDMNNFIGFSSTMISMIKQCHQTKGMMKLVPSNMVLSNPDHNNDLGNL